MIRAFVNGWDDLCHPSVWINTADEILKKSTVRPIQTRIIKGSPYLAGRIGVGYFGVVIDPGRSRLAV
jgi:hypothetical protein